MPSIPIVEEYTTKAINSSEISAGSVCCVKITYNDGSYVACYMGQYQPHALCVLTNNAEDEVYTKKYFTQKYNCETVTFRVEEDNPFAIQKFCVFLDTKSGDSFDNIMSNATAMANAVYYNKQSSTINDTVTLTTKMIPFLEVNVKVSYQKQQDKKCHDYIVKSISHDLGGMTSTVTLHALFSFYLS